MKWMTCDLPSFFLLKTIIFVSRITLVIRNAYFFGSMPVVIIFTVSHKNNLKDKMKVTQSTYMYL